MFAGCCDYSVTGSVLAVRVGDGIKTVVACIEVGKGSNAQAFADRCNAAAKSAPTESPEVAAAYDAWLLHRLRQGGTMTGGRTSGPTSATMERAHPFVKTVGPLPVDLGIKKGGWSSRTSIGALSHLQVSKSDGRIFKPRAGQLTSQLNAGDRIAAINGVKLTGEGATHAWLDQVVAAGRAMPPTAPRFMQVVSTMPYFQPNRLLTVTLPPGTGIEMLGLAGGGGKPPKLHAESAGMSALAASLGCQPGDVVVQATLDGVQHDTTKMSAEQLLALCQGVGQQQMTLLQPALTPDISHAVTWPSGMPR